MPLQFGGRTYRIGHPKKKVEDAEPPKKSPLFAKCKWASAAIGIALALAALALLFVVPKGPLP